MFLKSIRIENLRCLRRLELSFEAEQGGLRQWTMLLGENGAGKSTVLRGIALLLAGSEALPELLGNPASWIRLGARECRLEAELVTEDRKLRSVSLAIRRGDGVSEVIKRNHKGLLQLDRALKHTPRSYFTVGYGVSRRLSGSADSAVAKEEAFRHPRAKSVATLFQADAVLNSVETWAMDLHYRRGARALRVIRQALDKLLPSVSFDKIDRTRRRLLFKTPDGRLPLSVLSEGYQNVVAWCGDLLYRVTEAFEDYEDPLSTRGLLLVDELDLHLHPLWQRKLREFLTEKLPNMQLVVTTHSALTAQQAGAMELFFLRRGGRGRAEQLVQYSGDPQKLMLHQVFLSEAFGLQSLSSPQVLALRREHEELRDKGRLSSSERRRLAELAEQLGEIPDWSRETPRDRKLLELMTSVRRALGGHGAKEK
ncbi:MAG: AAA family ATPase [Planctomycetes bacterium]|nr:AAA family ATPase [Planctomycetota bacterium]